MTGPNSKRGRQPKEIEDRGWRLRSSYRSSRPRSVLEAGRAVVELQLAQEGRRACRVLRSTAEAGNRWRMSARLLPTSLERFSTSRLQKNWRGVEGEAVSNVRNPPFLSLPALNLFY
jgi:hypothetical protein